MTPEVARGIQDGAMFGVPEHVITRLNHGELVALNLQTEQYFTLDPVGARAFELASGGHTFGSLVEALLEEYEVDDARLRADLNTLFDDLAAAGLVHVRATGTGGDVSA